MIRLHDRALLKESSKHSRLAGGGTRPKRQTDAYADWQMVEVPGEDDWVLMPPPPGSPSVETAYAPLRMQIGRGFERMMQGVLIGNLRIDQPDAMIAATLPQRRPSEETFDGYLIRSLWEGLAPTVADAVGEIESTHSQECHRLAWSTEISMGPSIPGQRALRYLRELYDTGDITEEDLLFHLKHPEYDRQFAREHRMSVHDLDRARKFYLLRSRSEIDNEKVVVHDLVAPGGRADVVGLRHAKADTETRLAIAQLPRRFNVDETELSFEQKAAIEYLYSALVSGRAELVVLELKSISSENSKLFRTFMGFRQDHLHYIASILYSLSVHAPHLCSRKNLQRLIAATSFSYVELTVPFDRLYPTGRDIFMGPIPFEPAVINPQPQPSLQLLRQYLIFKAEQDSVKGAASVQ